MHPNPRSWVRRGLARTSAMRPRDECRRSRCRAGTDRVAAAAMPCASLSGSVAFYVQSYASIANRQWRGGPFDAAVCNFSLLGRESVDSLIEALPSISIAPGHLVVQTLHPVAACGELALSRRLARRELGGVQQRFQPSGPWYFRTLETWTALLQRCGFDILECREPKAAGAVTPASVIWIGKARRSAQT